MIPSKLSIFLLIALAYAMVIRADDDVEGQKPTDSKGLFEDLKKKVYDMFDAALEWSMETFKTTQDKLSHNFNDLKHKGKELFKDESENPDSKLQT